MSRVHVEYEMLCAFAAAGQLSEAELNELNEHVKSCSSCVCRLAQMEAASYAYFLRYADQAKEVKTPPGMQRRFEERAGNMGVPLRGRIAALPGTRLISLALSVVLLTVAAQVGWKVLSPNTGEETAVHVQTASIPPLQTATSPPGSVVGDPSVHRGSQVGLSGGRNIRRVRNAYSHSFQHREGRNDQSYSPPRLLGSEAFAGDRPVSPPGGVRDYLTSGLPLTAKRSFELTSTSRLLADGEHSIPAKRTFRYSPTFASLSFLGVPERVELPRLPAMNKPPPFFHFNSTKAR